MVNLVEPTKTVCVIDDDKLYIYCIKKIIGLKLPKPALIEFDNGQEAINYLSDSNNSGNIPDIILLDINMPVMDGWAFMERYVKLKPQLGKKITVYMVSSSIYQEDIKRAKNIADISDYVTKPISPSKFLEMVNFAA